MGELIQLVAYGEANSILSDVNMYSLNVDYLNMTKDFQNNIYIFTYDVNSNQMIDSHKVNGIIFELDEVITNDNFLNIKEKILHFITKLKLNIYGIKMANDVGEEKKLDAMYYIGTIPLYLGDIKYVKNNIIVKFPNNFFNNYNYFLTFPNYKYELVMNYNHTNTYINFIKNVNLNMIKKALINEERNIIYSYMNFLSHYPIQYCESITTDNSFDLKINSLVLKINRTEKIRGFFISIPCELDGFVSKIKFELKNNKEECELIKIFDEIKIFKETDLYNIYWIGLNDFDLNPYNYDGENCTYCITDLNDFIEIFFNSSIVELEDYNNLIDNILIDMRVKNYLVGTNLNLMLKYINGQINSELESNWIEKYNMNLDEKIKNIIVELIKYLKKSTIFIKLEDCTVEKLLLNENIIYLIKKYINLY